MSEKKRNIIGAVLLLVFVIVFVIGCSTTEPSTVISKAINICMECIGIG